jgi:hypothetical protein
MNIASLNALLTGDRVRVDDAALLPSKADQSQTIFVRLQSGDSDFADGFSAQKPENIAVSLLKVKTETGALSRQRIFELSTDQILGVAVNDRRQVLWWTVQPDPIVFRAETSDDTGRLSGKTLYRREAEMLISLPADERIAEVLLYRPIWDGVGTYSLELIGGLNLK